MANTRDTSKSSRSTGARDEGSQDDTDSQDVDQDTRDNMEQAARNAGIPVTSGDLDPDQQEQSQGE